MGIFSRKPATPATVPTDEIIPLYFWDNQQYARGVVLDCTFRFDDVMDTEKICLALERLLEIGEWRKLGARLRLNRSGKLEYHVPQSYNNKRPGFIYTTEKHDVSISDHPISLLLPKASDRPSVFNDPDISQFSRSSNFPKVLDDWIYTDRPQLSIHVLIFKDATLITVTWIHTLMDAVGLSGLFKAWTAVLRGREDEVPPFHGFRTDPVAVLAEKSSTKTEKEYVLANLVISGWALLLFAVRFLFDIFWYPKDEQRLVFLPERYVNQLREEALEDLDVTNVEGSQVPFISESDVLLSWISRTMLSELKISPSRSVTLLNVFDARSILGNDIIPSDSVYIGNITVPSYTCIKVHQVLQNSMGYFALRLRRSLEQQRTREQVAAYGRVQKQAVEKTGNPAPIGDSGMVMLTCSNWKKARFFEVDFSAAVISPGVPLPRRANKVGQPSYISATIYEHNFSLRNIIVVHGKDHEGNWWLRVRMRREAWPAFQQKFERIGSNKGL